MKGFIGKSIFEKIQLKFLKWNYWDLSISLSFHHNLWCKWPSAHCKWAIDMWFKLYINTSVAWQYFLCHWNHTTQWHIFSCLTQVLPVILESTASSVLLPKLRGLCPKSSPHPGATGKNLVVLWKTQWHRGGLANLDKLY